MLSERRSACTSVTTVVQSALQLATSCSSQQSAGAHDPIESAAGNREKLARSMLQLFPPGPVQIQRCQRQPLRHLQRRQRPKGRPRTQLIHRLIRQWLETATQTSRRLAVLLPPRKSAWRITGLAATVSESTRTMLSQLPGRLRTSW